MVKLNTWSFRYKLGTYKKSYNFYGKDSVLVFASPSCYLAPFWSLDGIISCWCNAIVKIVVFREEDFGRGSSMKREIISVKLSRIT